MVSCDRVSDFPESDFEVILIQLSQEQLFSFFLTPQSQDKFSVMIPGSLYKWFPGTYLVVGRWWSVVPAVVE